MFDELGKKFVNSNFMKDIRENCSDNIEEEENIKVEEKKNKENISKDKKGCC